MKVKNGNQLAKRKILGIFWPVLLRETRKLIQFLYAYKIWSPTDKRNTNEGKTDFFNAKFLDILCVFFHLFQLLLKLKSDEKLISKLSLMNMAFEYQNVLYKINFCQWF
jgi:hypothetical protein